MRERLAIEGGARAGDATADAEIAARQAQYNRAAGIEDARQGTVGRNAQLRAGAATVEQSQAQRAADSAGQAGLDAQRYISGQEVAGREAIGRAGMSAASELGQAGMQTADRLGQANLDSVNKYGQFSTGVAKDMAGQRYGAGMDLAGMKYGQGVGSAKATAAGAETVGSARREGEGAYRAGVAGQQGMAQQGGQAAQQVQLGAYGTQTQGITGNANGQASFETNKASAGDTAVKGAIGALFGNADGGMITEPSTRIIGERGPELVVPVSRYKSRRQERAA
jgi:hypothetical protein